MVQPRLNEEQVAAIMTALAYWADICNNPHLTEEQYKAGCSAMAAIEDAM